MRFGQYKFMLLMYRFLLLTGNDYFILTGTCRYIGALAANKSSQLCIQGEKTSPSCICPSPTCHLLSLLHFFPMFTTLLFEELNFPSILPFSTTPLNPLPLVP